MSGLPCSDSAHANEEIFAFEHEAQDIPLTSNLLEFSTSENLFANAKIVDISEPMIFKFGDIKSKSTLWIAPNFTVSVQKEVPNWFVRKMTYLFFGWYWTPFKGYVPVTNPFLTSVE